MVVLRKSCGACTQSGLEELLCRRHILACTVSLMFADKGQLLSMTGGLPLCYFLAARSLLLTGVTFFVYY
jgi:hypothetical protein